jgi:hypothetical protein
VESKRAPERKKACYDTIKQYNFKIHIFQHKMQGASGSTETHRLRKEPVLTQISMY